MCVSICRSHQILRGPGTPKKFSTVRSGQGPQDYPRIWRLLKRQHVTRLRFTAVKAYTAESAWTEASRDLEKFVPGFRTTFPASQGGDTPSEFSPAVKEVVTRV